MIHKAHHTFEFFLEKLSSIALRPIDGAFFRLIPGVRAEAIAETGGSFRFGGRYNRKDVFGGLYLAESERLAWLEMLRQYQKPEYIPDLVSAPFHVVIQSALDLTDSLVRQELDISMEDITDLSDFLTPRLLGEAAWTTNIEAIRFPSCPDPTRSHLVVFVDQLQNGSSVRHDRVQIFTPD